MLLAANGDGLTDLTGGQLGIAGVIAALSAGIGLALIEGLVDDVSIRPRTDGAGTCVRMSWPMLGELLLPDASTE